MDKPLATAIEAFFDATTHTVSYVVADQQSGYCAIIDPVLDFDFKSGKITTESVEAVLHYVQRKKYKIEWILETHAHADHLSAAQYIKSSTGGAIAIGQYIGKVQTAFKKIFNLNENFATNGSQFDYLFGDNEEFQLGNLGCRVLHTPGHTPACVTYLIGDAAFVGDTLFMPDYGTARTDFPGGDAGTLYDSIQRLLRLPNDTRLFMCHDYLPETRETFSWESTVAEQKSLNRHVGRQITKSEFITMREKRDSSLALPTLLFPAIQVNIRAGHLPEPEDNGVSYLKIPLDHITPR